MSYLEPHIATGEGELLAISKCGTILQYIQYLLASVPVTCSCLQRCNPLETYKFYYVHLEVDMANLKFQVTNFIHNKFLKLCIFIQLIVSNYYWLKLKT